MPLVVQAAGPLAEVSYRRLLGTLSITGQLGLAGVGECHRSETRGKSDLGISGASICSALAFICVEEVRNTGYFGLFSRYLGLACQLPFSSCVADPTDLIHAQTGPSTSGIRVNRGWWVAVARSSGAYRVVEDCPFCLVWARVWSVPQRLAAASQRGIRGLIVRAEKTRDRPDLVTSEGCRSLAWLFSSRAGRGA